MITSTVPCNGCVRCCKNDVVRILPSDDPSRFKTRPHPYKAGELALAHKPNGDCAHLGPEGCEIHEFKPQMCREMDCRLIASNLSFTQARKLDRGLNGALPISVWRRGKDLLKESGARK